MLFLQSLRRNVVHIMFVIVVAYYNRLMANLVPKNAFLNILQPLFRFQYVVRAISPGVGIQV